MREVYVGGERVIDNKAPKDFTLIKASTVYTPDGQTIRHGSILIPGQKIRAVGRDVSAPALATIRNYPNASIVADMPLAISSNGSGNAAASLSAG